MDALDLGILRSISRGSGLWWGSLDPRLSTPDVARTLGVDRKTVWSRLRAWRECGFHIAQEVLPNPRLFGAGMAGGAARVPDVRAKTAFIRALADVEHVLGGYDMVGEWVVLAFVREDEARLEDAMRAVWDLPGVEELDLCVPLWPPRPRVEPTPLDWRLIAAVARTDPGDLGEAAALTGVTPRTVTRRLQRLVDGRALWSLPLFDFRRYTGAVLARVLLTLRTGEDDRAVAAECRRRFDRIVWCEPLGEFRPASPVAQSWVEFTIHVDSAGEAEDVLEAAASLPEVETGEVFFPRRCFLDRTWFDARVQERIADEPPARATHRGA